MYYNPKSKKRHKSIKYLRLRDEQKTQKPTSKAYIFADVNGAGKTTLYYDRLGKGEHFGFRINIDEIVRSFEDWREAKEHFRVSKIA